MVNYDDFWQFVEKNNAVILDVRTSKEFAGGYIEGAININVDDLRDNLQNLDKERVYAIYCQVGLRGYLANRILKNNGFKVVNLNGGYNLWSKIQ